MFEIYTFFENTTEICIFCENTDNAPSSGKFRRQGFFHYWELFHYWERSELNTKNFKAKLYFLLLVNMKWTITVDDDYYLNQIIILLLYKAIDEKYPRPFASKLLLNKEAMTQNPYAILIPYYQGLFMWLGFSINAFSFEIWSQM